MLEEVEEWMSWRRSVCPSTVQARHGILSNEISRWASTCVMSASSSIFVAIFVFSYLVLHSIWLGCVSTTWKACCMCWKPPRFSNICHCHHIGPQGS